jgi:hypothetical protein
MPFSAIMHTIPRALHSVILLDESLDRYAKPEPKNAGSHGTLPLDPHRAKRAYSSWRVGRNRISFTSTSSGWLMAKTTARANEPAGIAICS